jgi:hypothetical protein
MWTTLQVLISEGITLLLGLFFGSFLEGYLKKKGKNLATHEDIDKLVDQVRAVTKTTKEIEAKISSDVWDRQKQWEMRREVLFMAAKRVSELDDALLCYNSAVQTRARSDERDEAMQSAVNEQVRKWRDAATHFDEARLLAGIVCGKELDDALDELAILTNVIVVDGTMKGDWHLYDKCAIDLGRKLASAKAAMRRELGINPVAPLPVPRSNVSSADPNPSGQGAQPK